MKSSIQREQPIPTPSQRVGSACASHVGRNGAEAVGRLALSLLLVGIVASFSLELWLARGGFFTTDELANVALAVEPLSLNKLLSPYWGHLILVPRLVYRGMLDLFGADYLAFRALGLLMNSLVVVLLFLYMRKLVNPLIALGAGFILLFFGSDWWRLLTGNAITVSGATACGLGAILAVQRSSRKGDLVACSLLVVGTMTYSVILPFAVYIGVWLLALREYRRLWVPAVPVVLFVMWRVYVALAGLSVGIEDIGYQGLDLKNLGLWPVWSLNALAAVLSSITGLTYSFSASELPRVGSTTWGAVLTVGLLLVVWRAARRSLSPAILAAVAAIAALFFLQVMSWIPEIREPDSSRYQYYGAVFVFLLLAAALRELSIDRAKLIALAAISVVGLGANVVLLVEGAAVFRQESGERRADVTAAVVAGPGIGSDSERYTIPEGTIDPANLVLMPKVEQEFGGLAYASKERDSLEPDTGARLDFSLINLLGVSVEGREDPDVVQTWATCREFTGSEVTEVPLDDPSMVILTETPADLLVRRYGPAPGFLLKSLEAGKPSQIVSSIPLRGWIGAVSTKKLTVCADSNG